MARYLILARSPCTAAALNAWLELVDKRIETSDSRMIIWQEHFRDRSGAETFQTLVQLIESGATGNDDVPLNNVTILVDAVTPTNLTLIADRSDWDGLIAMLIETFPEVRWIFGVLSGCHEGFPSVEHSLLALFDHPPRDPSYDPTGLRDSVRQRTNQKWKQAFETPDYASPLLPLRLKSAAIIDEEKSYAYFHGYVAYRFGYRTDVVTSWAWMRRLFTQEGKSATSGHGYHLLLEDMSLNFPDRESRTHLLRLEKHHTNQKGQSVPGRATHCPLLDSENAIAENSAHRILVTTGQAGVGEKSLEANCEYLKTKKASGQGRHVFKPVGGMLDLWERAELLRQWNCGCRAGNVPFFVWPPQPSGALGALEPTGHGAHGKLMLIAEVLLRRAETFRGNASTVKGFIRGAVLATNACELLGGKTPTLTYSALALKHEYEARAECAFIGVGYHFNVKDRQKEIAKEVAAVSVWFADETRQRAELDAAIVILNRIAVVFRDAAQFDEEHYCLAQIRALHRKRQRPESPLQFGRWIVHFFLWYAEWLLARFGRFLVVITAWLLVLMTGWFALAKGSSKKETLSALCSAFFGGNAVSVGSATSAAPTWCLLGFSCLVVALGVFHLGVFISHLYSLVSRR